MIAFLARIFGIQGWMVELILGVLLGTAAYGMFKHIEHIGAVREKTQLEAQAAADEKETAKRVEIAEHSHDAEINDLTQYRVAHPDVVRLCISPSVRATPAPQRSAGTAAPSVQPMPAGDSGSGAGQAGPDIFPMLDALAGRADAVTAELRERQRVEP